MRLAPFPPAGTPALALPTSLAGRGLCLRHATDGDLAWLRGLYASTRAAEMAAMPWPAAAVRGFLDSQFALQHQHYLSHFPSADFLVLEQAGQPLGRLYLQRSAPEHLLVDISLAPGSRGGGLGGALVQAAQHDAAVAGRDLCLHVQHMNEGARRLYLRLGFEADGEPGPGHQRMRWRHSLS